MKPKKQRFIIDFCARHQSNRTLSGEGFCFLPQRGQGLVAGGETPLRGVEPPETNAPLFRHTPKGVEGIAVPFYRTVPVSLRRLISCKEFPIADALAQTWRMVSCGLSYRFFVVSCQLSVSFLLRPIRGSSGRGDGSVPGGPLRFTSLHPRLQAPDPFGVTGGAPATFPMFAQESMMNQKRKIGLGKRQD